MSNQIAHFPFWEVEPAVVRIEPRPGTKVLVRMTPPTNPVRRRSTLAYLRLGATVLLTGIVVLAVLAVATPPAVADTCPDVEVVFARGTLEPPGPGATGQAFIDALKARLPSATIQPYAVNYPASLEFSRASDGVRDASAEMERLAANCPQTKMVLGGFSQGAAVAAYTTTDTIPAGFTLPAGISGPMPASLADHVAAVALFGKPTRGFLNMLVPDAPPITIGSRYAPMTIELCVPEDPVCSPTGNDQSAHGSYAFNGMAEQAADFAANAISRLR